MATQGSGVIDGEPCTVFPTAAEKKRNIFSLLPWLINVVRKRAAATVSGLVDVSLEVRAQQSLKRGKPDIIW